LKGPGQPESYQSPEGGMIVPFFFQEVENMCNSLKVDSEGQVENSDALLLAQGSALTSPSLAKMAALSDLSHEVGTKSTAQLDALSLHNIERRKLLAPS